MMTAHKTIIRIAAVATAAWSTLARPADAADVFVIAHADLAVSAEDIRDIYLGDRQITGGVRIAPLDNASLQHEFLDRVVRLDAGRYGTVWTKKGFREGLNAPPVKASDLEVASAVRARPGTIGYVSAVPAGVRVIGKY